MFCLKWLNFKTMILSLLLLSVLWFIPSSIYSQSDTGRRNVSSEPLPVVAPKGNEPTNAPAFRFPENPQGMPIPSIVTEGAILALLAVLPFLVMILTSFLKIVVVLSLLRTALGVQQAPPNQVINGVAFMLSLFVMYPTITQMYDLTKKSLAETTIPGNLISSESSAYLIKAASVAREPLREFLQKNSLSKHQKSFYRMAYRGLPEKHRDELKPDDFIVLIPSFITSQLKDAFEIGVLIYIPFFVIDLVTSNILLAMGMMMLSPVTISMPLKLFLLVMLDGWTLLIEGLISTYH